VKHKAVAITALQCVDDLLIPVDAQRGNYHRLGLTTGEQRRAVRARQHTVTYRDGANGAGMRPVGKALFAMHGPPVRRIKAIPVPALGAGDRRLLERGER